MAKVQYGIPAGATAQGLTNPQIAQLMLQMQLQRGQDPSQTPGYDSLGDYGQQPNHPVYSVGQGLADVAGQLGSAYFRKKRDQQLMQGMAQSNAKISQAFRTASDPNLSRSDADASDGNMSLATQVFDRPALPQERASAAINQLGNGSLAAQYADQLQKTSQAAQPPAPILDKYTPGEVGVLRDPASGQPIDGQQMGGGPALPQSPEGRAIYDANNGYFGPNGQGGPTGQSGRVLQNALDKDAPVTWRIATADENAAHGYPASTKGGQVSNRGEYKPPEKQPGQVGPAYDAATGAPLGVVDYTAPDIASKLATGELLPHEPKVLQTADADKLTKMGNMLQEYKQSAATYKPEYSRIVGANSKLRGFIGGKSYNEGADWFNHVNSIFIQGTKDVAGRSPQLIEEYNKNRPEATDASDVVVDKMNNLIRIQEQETGRVAKTYKRGGYLGQQVDQAAGLDSSVQQPGAANAPDPLGIRGK